MKCFTYTLNANGEGPAGRLPIGSLTGYMAKNVYYGAAIVDNLDNLTDFNATEITPLQFNKALTPKPTADNPNPTPALISIESEIRKHYAEKMKLVAAPYTPEERETWFVQVKEANDYNVSPLSPTPLLTAIANVRGLTVSDLVGTIIAKDNAYRQAIGAILGEQQALVETIWKTS